MRISARSSLLGDPRRLDSSILIKYADKSKLVTPDEGIHPIQLLLFATGANMVSTKLLSVVATPLLVTSTIAQTLRVTCYSGGAQHDCARFISRFCNHATVGLGTYAPFDSMARCFNNGARGKCDFNVWSKDPAGSASQTPSNLNCRDALNAVIRTCPSGGHGQYNGAPFQFTVDPNVDQCGGDVSSGGSRIASAASVGPSPAA